MYNGKYKKQHQGGFTMAIIPQQTLFLWSEIEELGDLERLRMVIENMPDEKLMRTLEKERGITGRDDFPVRAVWNSILAGVVFQHPHVESLRRELKRNGQLRYMCGLYRYGERAVPSAAVYTRFLRKLYVYMDLIDEMFDTLVSTLKELLPDYGKDLAMDSKAIESLAKRKNKKNKRDGRRDTDANIGVKTYKGVREDGTLWEKVQRWFGYKLHLVVDANYELPVGYKLTKASASDVTTGHKLIDKLGEKHPDIIESCETMMADRGYDDEKLIKKLYDCHGIKPVIDIRNMWKEPDSTQLLKGYNNIVYDYKGAVYCYCMETETRREMACGGYEKDRNKLKKVCPVKQYGIKCKSYGKCPVKHAIRIPLETDRRIFTPIDRASYKWERYYDKRTAVERVNSRLDVSFGLEHHYIRGIKKMKIKCGLALCVMLAMAVARIKEKQKDSIRSLIA